MEHFNRELDRQFEDEHDMYKNRISKITKKNMSKDEMLKVYDEWVQSYEDDNCKLAYTGPILTAKYAGDSFTEDIRPNVKILDIGAGTGLGAIELKKLGFKHIDALDPSPTMLNVAKERNLYENYYLEYLTDETLPIPENTYDCITGSGCFSEGHVPPEGIKEMIRLVTPGGYIILTTRLVLIQNSEYYKPLEPLMEQLEKEGKWKKIGRDIWPRFYIDKEAVVYCYQVL